MQGSMLDAIRLMVDHYPGGRPALAVRLGLADDTLRKQIAGQKPYILAATTASQVSAMCIEVQSDHCYAYIGILNAEAGGHFMRLPSMDGMCGDTARRFSKVLREFSDVAEEVARLEEGVNPERPNRGPTGARVRRVTKEWLELVSAGNAFVQWLQASVAASKKLHGGCAR